MVAPASAAQDDNIAANGRQRAYKRRSLLARKSKVLQVLEMQEELRNELDKSTNALEKVKLVDAWDKLEDRLRILQGKPLPGVLKPELMRGKREPRGKLSLYAMTASTTPTSPAPDAQGEQPTS